MNECGTYSKQGVVVWYPVRETGLSHIQIVQTSCGAHLTVQCLGGEWFFTGGISAVS